LGGGLAILGGVGEGRKQWGGGGGSSRSSSGARGAICATIRGKGESQKSPGKSCTRCRSAREEKEEGRAILFSAMSWLLSADLLGLGHRAKRGGAGAFGRFRGSVCRRGKRGEGTRRLQLDASWYLYRFKRRGEGEHQEMRTVVSALNAGRVLEEKKRERRNEGGRFFTLLKSSGKEREGKKGAKLA